MAYVDGFVLPLRKRDLDAYRRMARRAGKIWLEHGALEFRECLAEDLTPRGMAPFTRAVRVRRGETVLFSWIVFRSRAQRDRVNAKVMADPRIGKMVPGAVRLDLRRMLYGGFRTIVDLHG